MANPMYGQNKFDNSIDDAKASVIVTSGATTLTAAQIPAHQHGTPITGWPSGSWTGGTGASASAITAGGFSLATGATALTLENSGGGSSHTHSFSGSSSAVDILPPYLVVNYIIKT